MSARIREARWAIAAVLVLGLLLALIGGTLTAGDDQAEAATTITDRIIIPPAAFTPTRGGTDYANDGEVLYTVGNGTISRCFNAEVHFPVHMPIKKVNVNRVFMWADDNISGRDGSLTLYRSVPKTGADDTLVKIVTTDSPAGPTMYAGAASGAPVFLWNNGPYLRVCLEEDITFYGAAINYRYEQ